MKYETLDLLIGRIYNYFDYKSIPDLATRRAYQKKLKYIPDECSEYIYDFITNLAGKPRNLPVEMKNAFNIWKIENPDRISLFFGTDSWCNDCGKEGFLHASKIVGNHPYLYAFKCGSCSNNSHLAGSGVPRKKKDQLIAMGYIVEDHGRTEDGGQYKKRDVDRLYTNNDNF